MSALRFSIIDYTQIVSSLPTTTIIDEPVGLDKVTLHINRDKDYHGFSDMVDDSMGTLQFYNTAYGILSAAYQSHYGIDSHLECLIEFQCDDDDSYQTLYTGRFKMDTFKSYEGLDGCYAECVIENSYYLTMFRNRMGQKVSLDSLQTFDEYQDDGSTPYPPLTPYTALGQEMTLLPMMIRLLDYASIDTPIVGSNLYALDDTYSYSGPTAGLAPNPGSGGSHPMFYDISQTPYGSNIQNNEFQLNFNNDCCAINPFANIGSQEIPLFPGPVGESYNGATTCPSAEFSGFPILQSGVPIFTFQPDIPYANNKIKIDIELSWAIIAGIRSAGNFTVEFMLAKGQDFNDMITHQNIIANLGGAQGGHNYPTVYSSVNGCLIDSKSFRNILLTDPTLTNVNYFNHQYSFHDEVWFNPGDQLFFYVNIINHEDTSVPLTDSGGSPIHLIDANGQDFPPLSGGYVWVGSNANPSVQFVFFSDAYTFRNSYNGSPVYTISQPIDATRTSAPSYGPNPLGGPHVQYYEFTNYISTLTTTTNPSQPQSYLRLTFNSQYKSTPAPVYLINEALSRLAEIITNGNFRVYSDYFGRTDAQPYTSPADGFGALTAITNGLLIRGYSPLVAYMMGYTSFNQYAVSSSSATYTLDLTNIPVVGGTSDIVLVTNPAGTTVIIPTNASVAYPVGFQLIVVQGTGVATIAGATGVTIYAPAGNYSTSGLGSQILLTKVGTDIWLLASRSSMFCSFKELIDALNCVHTAGFAIEDDPSRSGYQRVRVEPIAHFYDSATVMLTCENVDIVETSADGGSCLSEIEIGYSKWEAEQAQGLDEFLTKRTYRTTLNTIRAKWNKLCAFVASGYAIETTRRRLGTNTTDWRYDKDNFVISVLRSGGGLKSENGGWVYDSTHAPSGMIDPDSVYNARISPLRNLLRWLKWLLPSYADPSTGQMIFTQGEGNYYASGMMGVPPEEADSLHENQTLTASDYFFHAERTPIIKNELVSFKYPLGFTQWQSIYATKYGLIKYNVNGGAWRYGYVQQLKYDLYEGMGEFTLKTAVI